MDGPVFRETEELEEGERVMSLLEATKETCVMMDRQTVSDGYGGMIKRWVDGAAFEASIAFDSSIEAVKAQAAGATELYTVLTSRGVNLQYHDVFRRESDRKIFRVTTDGDDDKTPKTAGLNGRKVRAEEWTLPEDSTV